jgi:hypothetical protein
MTIVDRLGPPLVRSADASGSASPRLVTPYGANAKDPTLTIYRSLTLAQGYFNRELFGNRVPECIITLQKGRKAYGYFRHRCYATRDETTFADEIALDPRFFGSARSDAENLSTLVHEMVHCEQAHFGKPGRGGYHNREWAERMLYLGLVPSSKSGKATGRSVTHVIREDGRFDRACRALLNGGFVIPYHEITGQPLNRVEAQRVRSRLRSKTPYVCAQCDDPPVRIWGRPKLKVICAACETALVEEKDDSDTTWGET